MPCFLKSTNNLTCIAANKSFEYFSRKRCVFLTDRLDQTLGFFGPEIAMMFIDLDSQAKPVAISLGMKLRRIHIFANTKHLYRTGLPAQ